MEEVVAKEVRTIPSFPAELFEPAVNLRDTTETERPSFTYWQDVRRRFLANKLAVFGLGLILVLIIMAIIGPFTTHYSYAAQSLVDKNLPPSSQHWFGTDDLGRDVYARAWIGARISLFIGFMAAIIDLVVGVVYGGISGLFGSKVDEVMMRIVEVLYGLPYLLVVILLMVVLGPGLFTIIVSMTATGWVNMARVVRGQVLQLKEMDYIFAAHAFGSSTFRILWKHLVPNTIGPIIVNMTLTVPSAIFGEAVLSFLGLGVPAPLASWGTMANDGLDALIDGHLWKLLVPTILISITILAFNVLGDGLAEAFDPKQKR
ncbi:ABC transporter permease (plasmid) [Alicyclobacillus fastidiosus]|uniref:ABC transporter permease n=1 Tax=Alicyclobacillus fastidiosus TaxID=392011 RepID=A0ABY6ZPS5_9BACL|nr:ABC transporter permease [Alicyclobacillus fastidiosus]WAH44847.1 ABC transporter permease [Alicyclobacillus fastidiosus]GMA65815.1 dipeptide transport system permease protein DppC [Alicyclobacillus fastidiosus]GMA65887.1 dipeptide transport system permease protein DppC [Alicyclobacillus fastidiosus]